MCLLFCEVILFVIPAVCAIDTKSVFDVAQCLQDSLLLLEDLAFRLHGSLLLLDNGAVAPGNLNVEWCIVLVALGAIFQPSPIEAQQLTAKQTQWTSSCVGKTGYDLHAKVICYARCVLVHVVCDILVSVLQLFAHLENRPAPTI